MQGPAPGPLHQEHLPGESRLGGGASEAQEGGPQGGRLGHLGDAKPMGEAAPSVTETKVKTVLTTPAPMVA